MLKNINISKRLWKSITIALALLLIISSAAYAYYLLRALPVYIEIIEGPRELLIYSEPNFDVSISSIQIAIFQRGTQDVKHLRVENSGVEPLNLRVETVPEVITWASVVLVPADFGVLERGQSANLTVIIYVYPDTPTGNTSFQLWFYEP